MQVFGFVDPGIGQVRTRVVDDGLSLVVFHVQRLLFEADGAPAELSVFIGEEAIDRSAVDKTGILIQPVA